MEWPKKTTDDQRQGKPVSTSDDDRFPKLTDEQKARFGQMMRDVQAHAHDDEMRQNSADPTRAQRKDAWAGAKTDDEVDSAALARRIRPAAGQMGFDFDAVHPREPKGAAEGHGGRFAPKSRGAAAIEEAANVRVTDEVLAKLEIDDVDAAFNMLSDIRQDDINLTVRQTKSNYVETVMERWEPDPAKSPRENLEAKSKARAKALREAAVVAKNKRDDMVYNQVAGLVERGNSSEFGKFVKKKYDTWGVDFGGDVGRSDNNQRAYHFKTSSGSEFRVSAGRSKDYNGVKSTYIAFTDGGGSYNQTGKEGLAGALEVFRNVSKAVVGIVKHDDSDVVTFSASGKSRVKLYDKLVQSVCRSMPGYAGYAVRHGEHSSSYYVAKKEHVNEQIARGTGPANAVKITAD